MLNFIKVASFLVADTDHHRDDLSGVKVNGDLRFGIALQNGVGIVVRIILQGGNDAVCHIKGIGEAACGFSCGVAEHDALISGTDVLVRENRTVDLRRLLTDQVDDLIYPIAELLCHTANDLIVVDVRFRGNLTAEDDGIALDHGFNPAVTLPVLF